MTSHNLLSRGSKLDEDSIRKAISGNICRCTGYASIVKAIMQAAAKDEKRVGSDSVDPSDR